LYRIPHLCHTIMIEALATTDWHAGNIMLIDKPLTWTSFQAINKVKWLLKKPKIGHSGTLDPLATGLLIVCTGKWTKKLQELIGLDKEYTGTITLGATTPSYDLETNLENQQDCSHITEQQIIANTTQFTGTIQQYPPAYSAVRVDGQRAYNLARKGKEVKTEARTVIVHAFEITGIRLPEIDFRIHCSSGTYIRTLANDFGSSLGVGGHLSALRRTKIGEHCVENAWTIDEIVAHFEEQKRNASASDLPDTAL
jgi:tRNA pseudouridine55 synthase